MARYKFYIVLYCIV